MKKQTRKLSLSRETLVHLETVSGADQPVPTLMTCARRCNWISELYSVCCPATVDTDCS